MASEERRNIHDQLDDLLDDEHNHQYYKGFGQQQEKDHQNIPDSARPSKANKKRKRKRNKKKKNQENLDEDYLKAIQNRDQIQLDTTPLKYKLGSSFYEDSDSSEDEGLPDYKIGGYHPMHVGYVIIQKLGWGHFSTVWLAKDINYNTFVAMKIQRSAPHYLEAAFDEVEILDQVSSYWVKPEWLNSLKTYYKQNPEKLKNITGNDCYCVQLLNCFIHSGPHGRHFVMVFEILGINLLEVIKRYNYKGTPLPLVRRMAQQCLIGLDYLHRVCKIIHTDLKPENVNLCLTDQEVKEIAEKGCLTTTKMYHQGAEDIKKIFNAGNLDPRSQRGRKEQQEDGKDDKVNKRAQKKKRQKQRKKEKMQQQREQTQEEELTTERDKEDPSSPDIHKANGQQQKTKKKNVQIMNKNDSSKPSPFNSQKQQELLKQQQKNPPFDQYHLDPTHKEAPSEFSLKNLNPSQMKELNEMLEQFVDVPRSFSMPRIKYNSQIHVGGEAQDNLSEVESILNDYGSKYDYDIQEYEKFKNQLEEFIFFRKKFEQSQRAQSNKAGPDILPASGVNKLGIPHLNLQNLDPRKMQQEIEEEKAKKRGPKLDENLRLKICDLGNGCWTYHHFSTEIQTRQYRSPEVIIGSKYGTSADIWSFACMIFEMATGDFLFEPRKGKSFDKDDDHLAQMMELLGRMPKNMALSGKHSRRFFDKTGHLRRIRGLNYWPLKKVLMEKYKFKEREAQGFADFLRPLLEWDPEKRVTAKSMLDHYWLKMPSIYDTKMSDEDLQRYVERQTLLKDVIDEPYQNQEMSKIDETDTELNCGDLEDNDNESNFSSDFVDLDEKPHPKEYRDIAEGKNLNNSFVGPYPENWDHLHIDKGANPQFQILKDNGHPLLKTLKAARSHRQQQN